MRCSYIFLSGRQCRMEEGHEGGHRFFEINFQQETEDAQANDRMVRQSAGASSVVGKTVLHWSQTGGRVVIAFNDGTSAILHTASGEPILVGSLLSAAAIAENSRQEREARRVDPMRAASDKALAVPRDVPPLAEQLDGIEADLKPNPAGEIQEERA